MNKQRRTMLGNIVADLESIGARIEVIRDEERTASDNIPENMEARIEAAEEILETLTDAIDNLDEVISQLHDVIA